MLLESNTKKVIELLHQFDMLSNIDKVRLALYLTENKNFNINFNMRDIIILLKQILTILDYKNSKKIINFSIYKHLLLFSAKYLELSEIEKKQFSIEILFNIYNTDFKNKKINKMIKERLLIFDYSYCLLN